MLRSAILVCAVLLATSPTMAQEDNHGGHSTPYSGFETREIASLSASDVAELLRGGGWGLALPAELQGKPGPSHLLELADELELTEEQVGIFNQMYEEMRGEAIAAGEVLIAAERALSDALAHDALSPTKLRELVDVSANARAELRYIHLSRHLCTTAHLTREQIHKYGVLRGYQGGH